MLRREYQTVGSAPIAEKLGRTRKAVVLKALKLGLCQSVKRMTEGNQAALRRFVDQGLCNACIARKLGINRHHIRQWRERLCLKPVGTLGPSKECLPCKKSRRAQMKRSCEESGTRNLAELKWMTKRVEEAKKTIPDSMRKRPEVVNDEREQKTVD